MMRTSRWSITRSFSKLWGKTELLRWTATLLAMSLAISVPLLGLGVIIGLIDDDPHVDPARGRGGERITDFAGR